MRRQEDGPAASTSAPEEGRRRRRAGGGRTRRRHRAGAAAAAPGWIPAAAGFMSGLVARVIVAPLDVLKVRLQVETGAAGGGGARVRPAAMLRMARRISRLEGPRALWKGTLPGVLLWAPYTSIQFAILESLRARLDLGPAAAGTLAGLAATFATFPMDTLRTVLAAQSEPRVYRSPAHAVRGIVRRGGVGALYSGLGATVLEVAPFSAVEFGVYALCRGMEVDVRRAPARVRRALGATAGAPGRGARAPGGAAPAGGGADADVWRPGSAASGMIAGTAARVAIHPLDVAKKRLQVGRSLMLERGAARFYGQRAMRISGGDWALGVAARILRAEGVAGLFRGILPGIAKASVSSALCFSLYESITALLLLSCEERRAAGSGGGGDDDDSFR